MGGQIDNEMRALILAAIFALGFASSALADDICTDRPSKGSAPCTVPAGHFQVESDLFNSTHQDGTDLNLIVNPTIKYGLTDSVDVEVNLPLYERYTNSKSNTSGVGDLYLLSKINMQSSGPFQWAIEPYVKVPTAHSPLGNGAWEGGVMVPTSFTLNSDWSLGFVPEFDVLKNETDAGTHLGIQESINLSRQIKKFTLTGGLWADYDFDPRGTIKQYSADVAVAYLLHSDLQLDSGVNFGLNKNTPSTQFYVGISKKF